MKEYRVEMLKDGRWTLGHAPSICSGKAYSNIQDAEDKIIRLRNRWDENIMELKAAGLKDLPTIPEDYRIVSREVSEWTVEEKGS